MKKIATLLSLILVLTFQLKAQEEAENPLDTLTRSVSVLQDYVENSKKLKFSGYIQAQYQYIDTIGAASFAGGNFAANTQHRMMIRRGRIKAAYSTDYAKYVLQFDVTEKGLAVKDAYGSYNLPFFLPLTFTAGIFDRPFGYEISYSSSLRESPERSMIFQTLFPGERDLGAKLTFQMPKGHPLNPLKFDIGLFNGTGPTAVDFDDQKDIIAHVTYNKSTISEKFSYGFGLSYYDGGNILSTNKIYSGIKDINDTVVGFGVDSSFTKYKSYGKRQFFGAEMQFNADFSFGMTTLRAEYLWGSQLGTSATTKTPSVDPATDAYLRNFNGGYIMLLQNLGTLPLQMVIKYDWYDPNTEVSKDQIGAKNSKLGKADISYNTIGFGLVYRFDPNVKVTFYYDMVTNEISKNLSGYTYDLKDNVFTTRVQYKF